MDCWLLLIVVACFRLWCFQPVLFSLFQTQTRQCHNQTMHGQRASVVWCFLFSNWYPWYSELYSISLERSKRQTCCFANGEQASLRHLVISHNGNMSPTCISHFKEQFSQWCCLHHQGSWQSNTLIVSNCCDRKLIKLALFSVLLRKRSCINGTGFSLWMSTLQLWGIKFPRKCAWLFVFSSW